MKTSERRKYEQLREALAQKQEEVRRLQEQCAALDSRAQLNIQPASIPTKEETMSEHAAVRIQSIHRGNISRNDIRTVDTSGVMPQAS